MKTLQYSINIFSQITESEELQKNYESPLVSVEESTILLKQKCLRANSFIPENTLIFLFHNSASSNRTRTSIQVAENLHIEAGEFGSCTNHSCAPNAAIVSKCNTETMQATVMLITLHDVHAGSELTFDYATTESTLTSELLNQPCLCSSSQCRRIMIGYNQLSDIQKDELTKQGLVANYLINDKFAYGDKTLRR
ncbi:MAG: SET domain-containing protein-lysine N-methyltransferase [Bacteroidales bacterium]|jgi:hypothetical protein|nr:SET domain-containing protein-lysine N-methyltransferase [Bacteroidales bacterium]